MTKPALVSPPRLPFELDDAELWAVARDVEYYTSDETFRILHSPEHEVLFVDPVPSDRLAEIYPPTYYSFSDPSRSLLQQIKGVFDRRLFRQLLRPMRAERLRVLDVGGGAGWVLDQVRRADPREMDTQVVDIDPEPAALARARGHRYFCGRVEDFPFDETYDLILLLNLVEHVLDPLALLQQAGEGLAPDGRILVKTPNWDSLDARIFRHRSWGGYHCPRHWVLFTRDSFEQLARRAGLVVDRFAYTQGAPFWAASVLHWMTEQGLARVDRERPVVQHPLFGPLNAVFAVFDFARMPWSKTSQMFFELRRDR